VYTKYDSTSQQQMLRKGLADLTEDASSRPISFWVNRFLGPRIVEAWIRIRFENEVADRCLSAISRRDRLGSRDRGRLSEAIFTALRRRGTVDRIVGVEAASEREQASQWLATALEQTWPDGPEPLPFSESRTPDEAGNLPPLIINSLGPDFDGLLDLGLGLRQRAPVTLRCHGVSREQLGQELEDAGVHTQPTPYSPSGLFCQDGAKLHQLEADVRAQFEIQDEGSQLLAMLVGAKAGERVLDACAGAGGKTLALLESGAQIEASDVSAKRLARLRQRLGAEQHRVKVTTLPEQGPLPFDSPFDRILIDAPCSGTGTARRAPDTLWRLTAEDLSNYVAMQRSILERFAPLVRAGGTLVYATCSILPQENQAQIDDFLKRHNDFETLPLSATLGSGALDELGDQNALQLYPHTHGTDGFFGAVLRRQN